MTEIQISLEDFKLIKSFYIGFNRKPGVQSIEFVIGWSELMPVVEKISRLHNEKFHYDVIEIAKGNLPNDDEYMDVICMPLSTPLIMCVKAVLKFIKWHNDQNK